MNRLNYFFAVLLLVGLTITANAQWQQIGSDFIGEQDQDRAGSSVSLSADGSIMAFGAIGNRGPSGNQFGTGMVRVFKNVSGTWTQIGADIFGDAGGDKFGYSVDLSADGNRIAVGAPYNDYNGSNSGQAQVLEFNGTDWVQLGSSIPGVAAHDRNGRSVSINADGTIIAIGADYNNNETGQARVFQYNGTDWVQIGNAINGQVESDNCGFSLSLNGAGDMLALASIDSDNLHQGAGLVRVFRNVSGSWELVGSEINGLANNESFGWSVDMNYDGTIFVAGGRDANSSTGVARVYKLVNDVWTQVGSDLVGDAQNAEFGYSVGINEGGTVITVGAQKQNTTNGSTTGQVNVYKYNNTDWVQVDGDIIGDNAEDHLGFAVALDASGTVVATGAVGYDDGANFVAGQVKVLKTLPTGINDISNSNISICPNPTEGIFSIDFKTTAGLLNVSITDITGKTIKQLPINNSQSLIDISNQPAGIYFVKIETNKGLYTSKIIKK